MKTNIKYSGLFKLIQYLTDSGSLEADRELRAMLRARNPKLLEVSTGAAEDRREAIGIPTADTLREWLTAMDRQEIEVLEGENEPFIVRPGDLTTEGNEPNWLFVDKNDR